ncbi:MAG TPA: tetratricopeptide repeat protein, partial [Polyangiaceae bacterium]|nr:tetratricopeptide repeat protein [Polyangiaceae bacterium]
YRRALLIYPSHPGCRVALEAMLDDPAARREAAAILRPLYEADGLNDKLLRVLEIEAEYADSVGEKLATIAHAVEVAERKLADPRRALSYAARGLRLAVGEPDLPDWIERAERLAALAGQYAELVELLRSAVGEIVDGDVQLRVTLRIADIARSSLKDAALAKEYYARALDLRGDDARTLLALDALYEETQDHAALLDIVRRRADAAESEEERRQLLFKQARLCDEKMDDTRAAIAVYEQILDMGLDPQAVDALERLYARATRWDDLVALYERQIEAAATSNERRAALHYALGTVLERHTGERERAFDEYSAALAIDSRHPQTVAALEALMSQREHAARAAAMLEPVYLARLDWKRVMATLEARLDVSQDPDERRQILRRLSKLHEEQAENYNAALETTALLLGEDISDETTWAELERLARVANAQVRLAEIYAHELGKIIADEPATAQLAKRAGELFEAQNDVDRALEFYRRAYAFNPEQSAESFVAIDRLLQAAGRPGARVQLYREALDYKNDPVERLQALHTIARLLEAELGDESGAIDTYRAALEVDERDVSALGALSGLYTRAERWRELAHLVRRRAEQSALAEDEARFRMDLASLLVHKLGEARAGIEELEAVVELVPDDRGRTRAEAVAALEQLLGVAEHKTRIIDILRPIYERADDWRRLVALNEERLSVATDDAERISILRESADLWEKRGSDPRRAFAAVRAAWILDPEDGDAREQLDRLATITRSWDDLASTYEEAIAKTQGLTVRELLSALARLHDQRRDDPRRALAAWERLFALDETELDPLDEMDALATLLSDWPTLVRVLTKKAELCSDDEVRASTWRRIGEAKRDMLDDADGAIEAYERALELEPTSALTVDYLLALYEQKKSSERLVDLQRRRVELCSDDESELRFRLLVDASSHYEKDFANPREAIECLLQALVVRRKDREVLERLDALYTRERMWPELLDNLKVQAEAARGTPEGRALNKRIAALHALQLEDPQSAVEAYRSVLEGGFDEESAAAIASIGESHDELRADAANALEPVFRAAGRYSDVAAVLELRLRAQAEPEERARTLRSLAEVAETALGQPDRAQSALIRALAEAPQDRSLHEQIERLAERLGPPGWQRYADALEERANAMFDANGAADLFVRLGRLCEVKLDDAQRAARSYASAAERLGDDPEVLAALDRLYLRLGETRRLLEVLERRVAFQADPAGQAELLYRLGSLQLGEFRQKVQALATLRQALERAPNHAASREAITALLDDDALFDDAFEALESVYRALGRGEDVARLYERRVVRAQTSGDRIRARLDLARIFEELTHDAVRAQRAVEAAVSEDPSDDDALSQLERLAGESKQWTEAANTLGTALETTQDLSGVARAALWVRLAEWRRDRLGDMSRAEDAFAHALTTDPENLDVVRAIEQIRRTPGRERELVQTLRMRARLESDLATKRDLLREAKGLAETVAQD